jgi:hypothetical protein
MKIVQKPQASEQPPRKPHDAEHVTGLSGNQQDAAATSRMPNKPLIISKSGMPAY